MKDTTCHFHGLFGFKVYFAGSFLYTEYSTGQSSFLEL